MVQARERIQEDGRARHHRIRLRLHLSDVRLRLHQRTRDAARGGLSSARSDSSRACSNGAKTLAEAKLGRDTAARRLAPIDRGAIKPGLLADLVIIDADPLENFKVLYGTGAVKLNDKTDQVDHIVGIKYTVKNGIAYDAKQLLADVAKMVEDQKKGASGQEVAVDLQVHRIDLQVHRTDLQVHRIDLHR